MLPWWISFVLCKNDDNTMEMKQGGVVKVTAGLLEVLNSTEVLSLAWFFWVLVNIKRPWDCGKVIGWWYRKCEESREIEPYPRFVFLYRKRSVHIQLQSRESVVGEKCPVLLNRVSFIWESIFERFDLVNLMTSSLPPLFLIFICHWQILSLFAPSDWH